MNCFGIHISGVWYVLEPIFEGSVAHWDLWRGGRSPGSSFGVWEPEIRGSVHLQRARTSLWRLCVSAIKALPSVPCCGQVRPSLFPSSSLHHKMVRMWKFTSMFLLAPSIVSQTSSSWAGEDHQPVSKTFLFHRDADDSPRIPAHELSNEKLKNLGLTFRSLEEVVHETVACLKELKYLEWIHVFAQRKERAASSQYLEF